MELLGRTAVRRCVTAGLALVMVGAGLGFGNLGSVDASEVGGEHVDAHGMQFDLPKGVDDYAGHLKEEWGSDGDSPLTVTLEITRSDGDSDLGNAGASEAFADAVRSEIRLRTDLRGQRLLDSMLQYTNGALTFDTYYFYSKADDAMYVWAPIPLADGSLAEFEVACPFDAFAAQASAIDGFFGSLSIDGVGEGLDLHGSRAVATDLFEESSWHGGGATVPDEMRGEPWADEGKADSKVGEGADFIDGFYYADGKGIGGKVPVTVTVERGKIASVTVGDNAETAGIGTKAIEQLPDAIVVANGTEGVDAVSGATITSKAIFTAVDDCLGQAATANWPVDPMTGAVVDPHNIPEGDTHAAITCASCHNDNAFVCASCHTAEIVVADVPSGWTVPEGDGAQAAAATEIAPMYDFHNADYRPFSAMHETAGQMFGNEAAEGELNLITCADCHAEKVIQCAACHAGAFDGKLPEGWSMPEHAMDVCEHTAPTDKPAPVDAAAPAEAAAGLKDGEYTAEGKGIGGKVPVTVTVEYGKVAEVVVGDNYETMGIGTKAIEQLPEAIVAAGGTEGVDGVSGATLTSKAIFTAVEDCLAQAGQ